MLASMLTSMPIPVADYIVPNAADGSVKSVPSLIDAVLGMMNMGSLSQLVA